MTFPPEFAKRLSKWVLVPFLIWGAALADEPIKRSDETLKLRRLGDKALADGFHDQAVKYYSQYRKAAAGDEELIDDATQCLIAAHVQAARPKDARKELEKLLAKGSGSVVSPRILLYKADVLVLENKIREAKNDYFAALKRILPIDDLYPRVLAGLGYCQIMLKEWDEALKTFSKLQKTGHGTDWAFHALRNKILILLTLKRVDEAREELALFQESGNECSPEQMNLLKFYMLANAGNPEKALSFYNQVKKTKIDTSDIYWFTAISRLAGQLMEKNDVKSVVAILNDAFARAPTIGDRQEILRLLINTHVKAGNLDEALETGKRFIEYYGETENGYLVRLRMAKLLHKKNKIGEALSYYGEVTKNAKSNEARVAAAREAAAILVDQKLYEEASKKYDFMFHHAENANERGEGKYGLGEIQFFQGNHEAAAELYLDVAKHFPAWREKAVYQAVITLMKLKEFKDAINLCDLYLKEFPKSKRVDDMKFHRALSTLREGDDKLAGERFAEFLKRSPEHQWAADALLELGNIAFDACEFNEAAERYGELVVQYPQSAAAPFAIYKTVYAKYLNNDEKGAIDAVERLVASYPTSKSTLYALFWLADYYRGLNDFNQAEMILGRIFDLFKNDVNVAAKTFYERAYVCFKAGKTEKALFYLDELTAKYPGSEVYSDGLFLAGDLQSRIGNYDKATTFYQKAAERKPGSTFEAACWGRLGDCYYSIYPKKNFDEKILRQAMDFYEKVLAKKDIPATFKEKSLYSLGKCHEFIGDQKTAAEKFREIIFNYDIEREDGSEREPVWMVKAALALIDIYLEKNTPEHAEKAVQVLNSLIEHGVEPLDDYRQRVDVIKKKYHLNP